MGDIERQIIIERMLASRDFHELVMREGLRQLMPQSIPSQLLSGYSLEQLHMMAGQVHPQPGPVVPPPANPTLQAKYISEIWNTAGSLGIELTYDSIKRAMDLLNGPPVPMPGMPGNPAPVPKPIEEPLPVGDIADHWYQSHDKPFSVEHVSPSEVEISTDRDGLRWIRHGGRRYGRW